MNQTARRQRVKLGEPKMKTKKEIAELAAFLAIRKPRAPHIIAGDALKLMRYAAAADTNAMRLCNVPDWQAQYDRKKVSIKKNADKIAAEYGLTAQCTGDPRGFCLRLFPADGAAPVRGNTWGGDDSGYGI